MNLGYRISLAVLPRLYVLISRAWFATCRLQIRDAQYRDMAAGYGAVIVPFWHYSIFYIHHHLRRYPAAALVSASRDGEYIARIMSLTGFEPVRGSANRQGMRALKQLLRQIGAGRHIALVADGSQGPARRAQPGAVYLATKTGAPLFPVVWAADRYKAFGSWDRTVLPMPFARVVVCYGRPYTIPRDLDSSGVKEYTLQLEDVLNELYTRAWSEFGRDRHDDGPGKQRY